MTITGNIVGLNKTVLERLTGLRNYQIPDDLAVDFFLAEQLAALTAEIGREIAVYVNRQGKVIAVGIGDDHTVALEEFHFRRGENRLSGVRCIHTHPSGWGDLSAVDLAALELLQFDAMVALGVNPDGTLNTVGFAWGTVGNEKPVSMVYKNITAMPEQNFSREVQQREKVLPVDLLKETKNKQEKAILVAVQIKDEDTEWENSFAELEELAKTAGLLVLQKVVQKKDAPDPATFIGRGKMAELRLLVQVEKADVVIFDHDLSPAQQLHLENGIGCKIIDRSLLILDIFAQRAKSSEGKLQVELAQLKYLLPRLVGQGMVLSRLGGGIGTRGPGETKLETDRRHIRRKIHELEDNLAAVVRTRSLHRRQRKVMAIPVVAIVGYTNAGKSSLLNALTNAGTFVEDQLFATLDTISRQLLLPHGQEVVLSDTVGFIRNLPHHLIAAFRATLEELQEADLLLQVIDGSNPLVEEHIKASIQVLKQLALLNKPMITVVNKIDRIEYPEIINRLLRQYAPAVAISAKTGAGLDDLLGLMEQQLGEEKIPIEIKIPFTEGKLLALCRKKAIITEEAYQEDGIYIKARVSAELFHYFMQAGIVAKK